MNRLNELADWIDSIDAIPTNDENLREIATLLRAASAETVGTEWPDSNPIAVTLEKMHNREIAAARLAVAAARAERDEAAARSAQLVKDLDGWRRYVYQVREAAKADDGEPFSKVIDRIAALQRELDAALEQQQGHACAMATLAEERDEALATTERHRNDTWQHAEACRTLEAERKSALHRIEQMQEVIDKAYGRWLLSSEMSTTSDSMARVLCPHATRRDGQQVAIDIPDFSPIMRGSKPAPVAQNATPDPDKSPDTVSGSPVKGPDLSKVGVFGPGYAPHPLSTGSTPAVSTQPTGVTPAVSPCDTRELIARLAEAVGNYFEDGTVMVADFIIRLRDIESAARKGGAE